MPDRILCPFQHRERSGDKSLQTISSGYQRSMSGVYHLSQALLFRFRKSSAYRLWLTALVSLSRVLVLKEHSFAILVRFVTEHCATAISYVAALMPRSKLPSSPTLTPSELRPTVASSSLVSSFESNEPKQLLTPLLYCDDA